MKPIRNKAFLLLLACLAPVVVLPALGEENTAQALGEFPPKHVEVRVYSPEQVPKPDLLPKEALEQDKAGKNEDPMEALRQEVQSVRDEIRMLQATLDLMINKIMADMRQENEVLREEVRRLYLVQKEFGLPDATNIPRPGIGIIRDLLEAAPVPEGERESILLTGDEGESPEVEEGGPPAPPSFTVLHEWGRTPEMVKEMDQAVSTLKGMVCIVPPDCRRIDLEQLGRDLRNQYDGFENINIEVFDDQQAAEEYIDTQAGDPAHRVLSISRHGASGRDVILYLDNGASHEVVREGVPSAQE